MCSNQEIVESRALEDDAGFNHFAVQQSRDSRKGLRRGLGDRLEGPQPPAKRSNQEIVESDDRDLGLRRQQARSAAIKR